jgi:hypothetical protein
MLHIDDKILLYIHIIDFWHKSLVYSTGPKIVAVYARFCCFMHRSLAKINQCDVYVTWL